jgi:hypothetical protein
MRSDTYTPQDINPPADGCEPDIDSAPEPDCAECGAPADEAHRKGCPEYAMTQDELEAQERADWRRYVGREPRYLRTGGRR